MIFKEMVESNLTYFTDETPDWTQAIHIACWKLAEKHIVDEQYADQVVANVREYGPYIVVVDGFAIPHCNEGNESAHETALSFCRFAEPIVFDSDPEDIRYAKVFITIASVNNEEHLRNMQNLFTVLDDESIFAKMMECRNDEDLLELDSFIEQTKIDI